MDVLASSINHNTVGEDEVEEEIEVKCADLGALFSPEIIARAQKVPDISVKE